MCVYTLDLMTVTTQSGDSIWSCQHHTSYRGATRSITPICCCCCLYWRKGKTNSPSSLFYPIYIQKLDIVNKNCAETFLHGIHSTRNYVLECDRNDICRCTCRSGLRYMQHYRSGTREQGRYSGSYPLICESLLSWAWELVSTATSEKRLSFTHCNRREQNCCWKPWGKEDLHHLQLHCRCSLHHMICYQLTCSSVSARRLPPLLLEQAATHF